MTATPYEWLPLKEEGRRLQSRVLEDYRRFSAIIRALLREQPKNSLKILDESEQTLGHVIEQHGQTGIKSSDDALTGAIEVLEAQVALLESLPDAASGDAVYVPDTNALLFNPQLEDWRFPDVSRFTLVLTTTVVDELDKLKVVHRLQSLRKRAEGLITRIKGYRGRGRLTSRGRRRVLERHRVLAGGAR